MVSGHAFVGSECSGFLVDGDGSGVCAWDGMAWRHGACVAWLDDGGLAGRAMALDGGSPRRRASELRDSSLAFLVGVVCEGNRDASGGWVAAVDGGFVDGRGGAQGAWFGVGSVFLRMVGMAPVVGFDGCDDGPFAHGGSEDDLVGLGWDAAPDDADDFFGALGDSRIAFFDWLVRVVGCDGTAWWSFVGGLGRPTDR